jgi:transcriptional regulator with XRE-family HTH domain
MQQIAARIEALRAAKGISQTELATLSAIPRATLKRRMVAPEMFTIGELLRVADALDTKATDLTLEAAS